MPEDLPLDIRRGSGFVKVVGALKHLQSGKSQHGLLQLR